MQTCRVSARCGTGVAGSEPMVRKTAASQSDASWGSRLDRRSSPGGYNQNIQLFQTPDYVVILNEMVHDVTDRTA